MHRSYTLTHSHSVVANKVMSFNYRFSVTAAAFAHKICRESTCKDAVICAGATRHSALSYPNHTMYNSMRCFSSTSISLKNATSRKSIERTNRNGKRRDKESSKSEMITSAKTLTVEAMQIAEHNVKLPERNNKNSSKRNVIATTSERSITSVVNLHELSNTPRKRQQQQQLQQQPQEQKKKRKERKQMVELTPSLSASVIVEPVLSHSHNSGSHQSVITTTPLKVRRGKGSKIGHIHSDRSNGLAEELAVVRSPRSRQQKKQINLVNTLLLNSVTASEKSVISKVEESKQCKRDIIKKVSKPGRPRSSTTVANGTKQYNSEKSSSKNLSKQNTVMTKDKQKVVCVATALITDSYDEQIKTEMTNTVTAQDHIYQAKSSNSAPTLQNREVNKSSTQENDTEKIANTFMQSSVSTASPSITSTENENTTTISENNTSVSSDVVNNSVSVEDNIIADMHNNIKTNNIYQKVTSQEEKPLMQTEHVDVTKEEAVNNNNVNKKDMEQKSVKVITKKLRVSQRRKTLEEPEEQEQQEEQLSSSPTALVTPEQNVKVITNKSSCDDDESNSNKMLNKNKETHQEQEQQLPLQQRSRSKRRPVKQLQETQQLQNERQVVQREKELEQMESLQKESSNARELNEDELIAQRASITKLFMVSDSVAFMFSALPGDEEAITNYLSEVDKAILPNTSVQSKTKKQQKRNNNNNNNNNNEEEEEEVYDNNVKDAHLVTLSNALCLCDGKNVNYKRRRGIYSNNSGSINNRRHAVKTLSRREAFLKVADLFRRMLIEHSASHKIYIHVRDLQEQAPPAYLLPASSSSSSTSSAHTTWDVSDVTDNNNGNNEVSHEDCVSTTLPHSISALTDFERFIKLQEWRKLAHAQAAKSVLECSVPAKYHTITRVRFADPARTNWTIVLPSNSAKNVHEVIAEMQAEERRREMNKRKESRNRRGNNHNNNDDNNNNDDEGSDDNVDSNETSKHRQQFTHHNLRNEPFDDIFASSGTEVFEEEFDDTDNNNNHEGNNEDEDEDEDEDDGSNSDSDDGDHDSQTSDLWSVNCRQGNKKRSASAEVDRRKITLMCMQEFSRLAQNVLRNSSKHGHKMQHPINASPVQKPTNTLKLISCANEQNPFFLKPLLTVCATCVPRRESRLGQRVSEREFLTGKVDPYSVWLNGITLNKLSSSAAYSRRNKLKEVATTTTTVNKNVYKASAHKRKNLQSQFPLRELTSEELNEVVMRRGVPAMPRYSTRITMLIEYNELSPTDLISLAEERRGVGSSCDTCASSNNNNYKVANENDSTLISPSFSSSNSSESSIASYTSQRQVYEKVKAAHKLNKPIRLYCLITDGTY